MNRVDLYWAQFLGSFPKDHRKPGAYVEAFFFGTDPSRSYEITRLVLDGTKTATGSLLWALEADGKNPPSEGDYWVVTNGDDDPACILLTTDARVIPFDEVGVDYARWGGEGNRTLDGWRELYWRYIVEECRRIERAPDRKAPLVMERFEMVYAEPQRNGLAPPREGGTHGRTGAVAEEKP